MNEQAVYCKIKKNDVLTIQVVDVATKAQYGNITVPYNNSNFSFQIQNGSLNGTPELILYFIVLNKTLDYLLVYDYKDMRGNTAVKQCVISTVIVVSVFFGILVIHIVFEYVVI